MKRKIITLIICFIAVILYSFTQEKKYTISVTIQEAQGMLNVIEQSNASHLQVNAVKELILGQINAQIKADSVKGKKP